MRAHSPELIQVVVARNKISTQDKYQDCLEMPAKFEEEVKAVLEALWDEKLLKSRGSVTLADLEVLVANPGQTLKLRTLLCQMTFELVTSVADADADGTTHVTADKLAQLAKVHPFLSQQAEFKRADALLKLTAEREKWIAAVKTARASNLQLRFLRPISAVAQKCIVLRTTMPSPTWTCISCT